MTALVLACLALAAALAAPAPAGAQAVLAGSDPVADAVLPAAPPAATLRFTEPLEQSYGRVEPFDAAGEPVPGSSFRFGGDRYAMAVPTPPGLVSPVATARSGAGARSTASPTCPWRHCRHTGR